MRKLIYSMGVSLDGYIAGPAGEFDWATPDEELHRFHNQQARQTGVHLYGRRLYETMRFWETAERDPSHADYELEFARVWKGTPKIVFSRTLETVEGDYRLVRENAVEEVARLKEGSGADLAVGGAGLAAELIRHRLVDELQPFVYPTVAGGGTPYLPSLEARIGLELVETRTFGSRVVYLRYRLR
jgi:dihydrofolate reductase